ncbi:MAG: T9SS type A sorting domain-containing protein [Bacteroidota bacterium]
MKKSKKLSRLIILLLMMLPLSISAKEISKTDSCCFQIPPIIISPGDSNVCCNDSLLLCVFDTVCLDYQWYLNGNPISNSNSPCWWATQSGNYSVVVHNTCDTVTSDTVSINFYNIIPNVTVLPGSDTICFGDTICLHLSQTSPCWHYQWMLGEGELNNATNSTYCATQPGTYSCYIYSDCDDYTTATIHITVSHPVVSISCVRKKVGCYLTANPSGGIAPYTFLWSNAATTQTIAIVNGSYTVTVTDHAGCTATATGSCALCSKGDLKTENIDLQPGVFAYPNPAQDKIAIELELNSECKPVIEIRDMTGRIVFSKEESITDYVLSTIDVKDLPNGLYIVHVIADGKMYEQKIVVQK